MDDFAQDKSFIIFLKKKYVKDFFLVFQFYCSDIDEFSQPIIWGNFFDPSQLKV